MNKTRLEAFSDGVFSIVMTLLAIELHPFELHGWADFLPFLPKFLLFILSFITIAIWWINHHQLCVSIKAVNNKILWLNTLTLLFITIIPFSTSLLGENLHSWLAISFYSFNMFVAGFIYFLLIIAVHGDRMKTFSWGGRFIGIGCYGLATVLSLLHQPLAYILVCVPLIYYFVPKSINVQ